MSNKPISFRLRSIDTDLKEALKDVDSETLAEMCRDGLRHMLGITTKPVAITKVVERPLNADTYNAPAHPLSPTQRSVGRPAPPLSPSQVVGNTKSNNTPKR